MESAAIGILALSGIAAVAAMVAFAFGRHVVSALDSAFSKWRRMGFVGRIVTAAMVVVATVEAQKKCSNVGMNEYSNVNDSIASFKHSNIQTFKHYFSLEEVITNDSYSYSMPASAVRYPNWWMRGGYEDVFKLELGDWRFPIGTNLVDYLWVYIWGKVRPRLKAKELEIAAVDSPMSAVPQVSEFWYMDGTNGSKILTWHNFFVGRIPISELDGSESEFNTETQRHGDTNGSDAEIKSSQISSVPLSLCVKNNSVVPISAQLELFPNGDYIARSNNVARYYKRVNPDDWDDDGIPNDIDANPEGSDGENFGPDNDLPEGANSSNYCWVVAGHFGMTLYDLFLTPRTVSFGRLYVEEIPSDEGSRYGYFLSSFFDDKSSHGYSAGAGIWRSVLPDNTIFTADNVTFGAAPPPWDEGGMVWPIPMGWHTNNVPLGAPPIKEIPCSVSAVYTMMNSGKGIISKLGHWVSRDTNDVIVVDGKVMKGDE